MEWTDVQKNWNRVQTNFRTKWNKLTDDDLKKIGGQRNQLLNTLESKYGLDHAQADRDVRDFVKTMK